ncbi:putative pollen-specific leucine-rich repeat extensin-like protein 3 [Iris pallida]|uniref:Pollen-specific leucine-rich repeat extensin-like protein 3 n=1 Tax=Iris pallida TaxID=29817 RepID=A0AAX6G591_IRIPA|nr:putative pollen-specific leucine-rich repeat extensin-like protein 3 [Iris pallida]
MPVCAWPPDLGRSGWKQVTRSRPSMAWVIGSLEVAVLGSVRWHWPQTEGRGSTRRYAGKAVVVWILEGWPDEVSGEGRLVTVWRRLAMAARAGTEAGRRAGSGSMGRGHQAMADPSCSDHGALRLGFGEKLRTDVSRHDEAATAQAGSSSGSKFRWSEVEARSSRGRPIRSTSALTRVLAVA